MSVINLEDIKPGMTLVGEVRNRRGQVLLAGEIEITEKHLRVLRMWGVTEAEIEGVEREQLAAQ